MAAKEINMVVDAENYDVQRIAYTTGGSPNSSELFKLARALEWHARQVHANEASVTIEPGKLYYSRGKRGVSYVIVSRVENGKVYCFAANKDGKYIKGGLVVEQPIEGTEFPFYEPQHLRLKKMTQTRRGA